MHPGFLGGAARVSSSATTALAHAHTYAGIQPYAEARVATRDDISACSTITRMRRARVAGRVRRRPAPRRSAEKTAWCCFDQRAAVQTQGIHILASG